MEGIGAGMPLSQPMKSDRATIVMEGMAETI